MTSTLKSGFLFLFTFFLHATATAQTCTVSGRLITDKAEKGNEGLPYGNLVILNARDSSFVKGGTSDENGYFKISYTASKDKYYLLKASYIGYEPVYLNPGREEHNHIGGIILKEKDVALDEIVITGEIREIKQVGDTTVINVSAYKTPEGSYLEELVKRIPGLEYDRQDQLLTYNGQPINEININGESFFSGDKRMAIENLPVNVIGNIRVYDKKNELDKITGVRTGKENYVLDLQTKEEFNGIMLASVKAGRGNNNKKEAELLANYFKQGGDNGSLIMRSDNKNLHTRYSGNIQNSAGVNLSKNIKKKLILNGNLIYNGNKQGSRSTAYNEQYLSSGSRYQSSTNEAVNHLRHFNAKVDFRWQIDELTFLNLNSSLGFTRMESNTDNNQETSDNTKVNVIDLHSVTSDNQNQYGFDIGITRKLNTRGNSLSFSVRCAGSEGENENFNLSTTTYYRLKDMHGNDSVLYRNQYQLTPTTQRNYNASLMFTHPFTKKLRLQLAYDLRYGKQKNSRKIYDLSGFTAENGDYPTGYLPDDYEAGYTDSLSNHSHSHTVDHDFTVRMNYTSDIWSFNAAFSAYPERRKIDQKTGTLLADTVLNAMGFCPSAELSWREKQTVVRLYYRGDTRQPSLTELLVLTDNSDPLNITRGNPNLKPSYNQSVRLELQNTKKGFFASLYCRNEINSVTSTVIYDLQTGGRESYPVNTNGSRGAGASFRYEKRMGKFRLASRSSGGYDRNVSLVNEGQTEHPQRSIARTRRYASNVRLSYQPRWGGIDLAGDWRMRYTSNSLRQANNYTRDYKIVSDVYVELPGGVQLQTDAAYSFRNGTNIKKGEDNQIVWNAQVCWRFMKKKRGELSMYWADIFSRRKSYDRTVTTDGVYEQYTEQTGGYFMMSFKYRFD